MSPMDWQAWARTFEYIDGPRRFEALFAEGGRFCDPVTPWTTDVRKVATDTDAIFPDWRQRVDRIRGGDDWAVFEWTGTGTFPPSRARPASRSACRAPPWWPSTARARSRHGGTTSTPTSPRSRSQAGSSAPSKAAAAAGPTQAFGGHRLHVGHAGVLSSNSSAAASSLGHLGVDVGVGEGHDAHVLEGAS